MDTRRGKEGASDTFTVWSLLEKSGQERGYWSLWSNWSDTLGRWRGEPLGYLEEILQMKRPWGRMEKMRGSGRIRGYRGGKGGELEQRSFRAL